jgi:hypothetical protein
MKKHDESGLNAPEADVLRRMLNTPPRPHKRKAKKQKAPK